MPIHSSDTLTQAETPPREAFCSALRGENLLERADFAPQGFRSYMLQILDSKGKLVRFENAEPDVSPQHFNAHLNDGSGPYTFHTVISGAMDRPKNEIPKEASVAIQIADQTIGPREMREGISHDQHQLSDTLKVTISDNTDAFVFLTEPEPTPAVTVTRTPAEQAAFMDALRTGEMSPHRILAQYQRMYRDKLLQFWHLHLKRTEAVETA